MNVTEKKKTTKTIPKQKTLIGCTNKYAHFVGNKVFVEFFYPFFTLL